MRRRGRRRGQESLQLGEVGAAEEAAGAGEGVESLQLEAAGGVEGVEPLQLDKSIISPGEGEDDDEQRKAAAALTIQSHQRGVRDRKTVESRKEAKAHIWKRPSFQEKGAPALVLGENGVLTLLDESPAHQDDDEVEVDILEVGEAAGAGEVVDEGEVVAGEGVDDAKRQADAALVIQSRQRGLRDRKAVESRKEAKAHVWKRPSFQEKGAPPLTLGADGVLTLLDESPAHEEVEEAAGAGANPEAGADAPPVAAPLRSAMTPDEAATLIQKRGRGMNARKAYKDKKRRYGGKKKAPAGKKPTPRPTAAVQSKQRELQKMLDGKGPGPAAAEAPASKMVDASSILGGPSKF